MTAVFVSRLAASAIAFLVLIVLARLLDPADYGQYSVLQLTATVLFATVLAWAGMGSVRFHHDANIGERVIPVAFGTTLIICAAVLAIGILLGVAVFPGHSLTLIVGTVFLVAHAIHEIGLAALRAMGQGNRFAASVLARPIVGVALAIALIYAGGGAELALLGMAVGALVSAVVSWSYICRKAPLQKPDRQVLAPLLRFGLPLGLVSSGTMVIALVSQTALGLWFGLASVGYFAAAQVVAMRAISLPMMTLAQSVDASIFRAHEAGDTETLKAEIDRYASLLLFFTAPLAAVIMIAHEPISFWAFGAEKGPRIAAHLPPLALAAFLTGLQGAFFSFAFTISKRSNVQMAILAILIGFHILATATGLELLGSLGASYAALLTAGVGLGVYIYVGRTSGVRIRLPRKDVLQVTAAVLAAAPFGIAANMGGGSFGGFVLILLGGVAYLSVLAVTGQAGFRLLVSKIPFKRRRMAKG